MASMPGTDFLFSFLPFFLVAPVAYGSSQVQNQILAAAATYATAVATPDP